MKKIDFVIAWVDGNDPQHRLKRQRFQNETVSKNAVVDTRFASNDEIYFSIASILKYAPYSGTIYIVTDQQIPAYLDELVQQGICDADKIKIIDHQVLFKGYESVLPTFNSLSIETMLWNIPDLSDYFIYLNDDFFFNSPSIPEDFLEGDRIKIYGHWRNNFLIQTKFKFKEYLSKFSAKPLKAKYTTAQMLSSVLFNQSKYFEVHHRPHIMDRHILENYFLANESVLKNQIGYRFRNAYQFLPVGLNNQLKIQANQAELLKDIDIAYLKNANSLDLFQEKIKNQMVKFGCIQSLDQLKDSDAQRVHSSMTEKLKDFLSKSVLNHHKI